MNVYRISSFTVLALAITVQAHAQSSVPSTSQTSPSAYSYQRGFGTEATYSGVSTADESAIAKDGAAASKASKINRGFGTEDAYWANTASARKADEVEAEGARESRASKINRGFGTDAAHWDQPPAAATFAKSSSPSAQ